MLFGYLWNIEKLCEQYNIFLLLFFGDKKVLESALLTLEIAMMNLESLQIVGREIY